MSLLGTGTGSDQLPSTGRLGTAAFINVDDLKAAFAPVLSLDQVRAEPNIQSKYIVIDNAGVVGLYRYDSADTTTTDNNTTVFVTIDGRRYKPVMPYRTDVTGSRPNTVGLVTGYQFYDTSLGKPIWWSGSVWKDASGTTV